MNEGSTGIKKSMRKKVIIKKCHVCGHMNETTYELEKCKQCRKSFLPSHYFAKIHNQDQTEFEKLFNDAEEMEESRLIKGLYVIW